MSRLVPLSILIRSRGRVVSQALAGLASASVTAAFGSWVRSIQPLGWMAVTPVKVSISSPDTVVLVIVEIQYGPLPLTPDYFPELCGDMRRESLVEPMSQLSVRMVAGSAWGSVREKTLRTPVPAG